jgi:hypothetical protein
MLRYPTLDVTTSKCIVLNRCSRNCSTPNLKIVLGQGGSLHCIFLCNLGVAYPGGAELGPIALVLGMGKIRLPNAGASVTPALKGSRNGSLTLAHLLQWRLRNAGVERGRNWLPNAGASIYSEEGC